MYEYIYKKTSLEGKDSLVLFFDPETNLLSTSPDEAQAPDFEFVIDMYKRGLLTIIDVSGQENGETLWVRPCAAFISDSDADAPEANVLFVIFIAIAGDGDPMKFYIQIPEEQPSDLESSPLSSDDGPHR